MDADPPLSKAAQHVQQTDSSSAEEDILKKFLFYWGYFRHYFFCQ